MIFDKISIAYLIICAVFIILGLIEGLVKTLLGFFRSVTSIIVAAVSSKPIAKLMITTSLGIKWRESLETTLASKGEIFAETYSQEYFDEAFSKLNLPSLLKDLLLNIIKSLVPEATESMASAISKAIIYYAFIVISFVVIFFLIKLLFRIIIHFFNKFEKKVKPVKFVNRLSGMIIYYIMSLLAIGGISYIFTLIIGTESSASTWLINEMHLNDNVFTISKYMYNHNALLYFIQLIQNWMFTK